MCGERWEWTVHWKQGANTGRAVQLAVSEHTMTYNQSDQTEKIAQNLRCSEFSALSEVRLHETTPMQRHTTYQFQNPQTELSRV